MLQFITDRLPGLEEVLRGGCRWVQLRMKYAADEDITATGVCVATLCRRYGAKFIIDDRVDLVKGIGANGVHLGKQDMPVREARAILGEGFIIGATANTLDDIRNAVAGGADYIGLGPFRFTTTKKRLSPILGLEGYSRIMEECRNEDIILPVVAIGGIGSDDIPALMHTGITGVAVSGSILNSPSPEMMTKEILKKINTWKN